MEKWIDEAFARACEKMERGAKRAAEQGIIPYMGQKDGYSPAPYDGNSWWTGGLSAEGVCGRHASDFH